MRCSHDSHLLSRRLLEQQRWGLGSGQPGSVLDELPRVPRREPFKLPRDDRAVSCFREDLLNSTSLGVYKEGNPHIVLALVIE